MYRFFFFFSSRRRHTRSLCDWSSDVCSSDLDVAGGMKDELDLVLVAAEFFRVSERQSGQVRGTAIDFFVGEKWILGNVFLRLLAGHHAGRVVQIGRASCRERV